MCVSPPLTIHLYVILFHDFSHSTNRKRRLLAWLSDYFTNRIQYTSLGNKTSKCYLTTQICFRMFLFYRMSFSRTSVTVQRVPPAICFNMPVMSPFLATMTLKVFPTTYLLCTIFFCKPVLISTPLNVPNVFFLSRSPYSSDPTFIKSETFTKVDSVEYLRVVIDKNPK